MAKKARRKKLSAEEEDYLKETNAWLASERLETEQLESLIEAQRTEITFHREHIKRIQALLRLQQQKVGRAQREFVKWKTKVGL